MLDYYEILEVSRNASIEVIEKAYKALVMKYHPDLHSLDKTEWAEEKLKQINNAYEIFSDSNKRSIYDKELSNNDTYYKSENSTKKSDKKNPLTSDN